MVTKLSPSRLHWAASGVPTTPSGRRKSGWPCSSTKDMPTLPADGDATVCSLSLLLRTLTSLRLAACCANGPTPGA
eukprot:1416096-Rhodomonas_salina.1